MSESLDVWMYAAGQLFLVPVLVAIGVAFGYAFFALGGLLLQWGQRARGAAAGFELLALRAARPGALVADLEARALARLELPRIVTRVAPMLGLVATMIPLGPALRALGAGDMGAMGRDLAMAFSAVILALLASAITYVVSHVRRRWYAEELLQVEKAERVSGSPVGEGAP
jgi:hypothetical protein